MVGERYFGARDRLLGCFARIASLADACGLDHPDAQDEARPRLARPLRLVVLGEVNAGKSTLLNALVGADLCPAAPLPTTRRTSFYRYSGSEREAEAKNGWLMVGRPLDFLKRFELIDTPGTNSGWRDSVMADIAAFERTDFLMVVFPSENTWTAATWDFVSSLSDDALGRTALVVQQADKKSPEDLRVIEGHMRELSMKKVGRALPIVAVAAGLALEAKLDPRESRKSWSASRFGAFEDFLTRTVCDSADRRYLLDRTAQEASNLLRRIETELDRQRRAMGDDGWFLAGLEREANQLRDLILETSPKALAGARARYEHEVARLTRGLRRRLGVGPTLWRLFLGDSAAARTEAGLADGLRAAIDDFAKADAGRLQEECTGHWEDVRPRVIERMALDPGEPTISEEGGEKAAEDFLLDLSKSVPTVLGQLRVRASLDVPLRLRNQRLKALVALVLLLWIAAGICGSLSLERWAGGLALTSLVATGVFVLAAWLTGMRIVSDTRERLQDASGRFEASIRGYYLEAVRSYFATYSNGLIGVRRQLAEQQESLKPRQQAWDRLHLELRSIEQDMS